MVSRLETLGYIKRETSPTDRRTDVVNITPDGITVIAGVADILQEGIMIVEKSSDRKKANGSLPSQTNSAGRLALAHRRWKHLAKEIEVEWSV